VLSDDLRKTPEKEPWSTDRCPYLGLAYDRDTVFSTASEWNRCFHTKRAFQVALEHQTPYCLTPGFPDCDVYKGNLTAALPKDIRLKKSGEKKRKIFIFSLGSILSVLFLAGLLVGLGSLKGISGFFGDGSSTRTATFVFITKTTLTSTITIFPSQVKVMLAPTKSFSTSSASLIPPALKPTASSTSILPTLTPTASLTSTRYLLIPTNTPVPTNPPSRPKRTPVPPPINTPVPPTAAPTDIPTQANPAP
jgi:hypothetical protein